LCGTTLGEVFLYRDYTVFKADIKGCGLLVAELDGHVLGVGTCNVIIIIIIMLL